MVKEIPIKITNNIAEIRLNKEIYEKELILEALKEYLDVFNVILNEEGKYYVIYLKPKEEIERDEIEEFAWLLPVYILSSMKE